MNDTPPPPPPPGITTLSAPPLSPPGCTPLPFPGPAPGRLPVPIIPDELSQDALTSLLEQKHKFGRMQRPSPQEVRQIAERKKK